MMIRKLHWSALAVAIGLAVAGTASAQGAKSGAYGGASYGGASYGGATAAAPVPAPPAAPVPAPPEQKAAPVETATYEAPPAVAPSLAWYERYGLAITAGGGVEGFASGANTGTSNGGGWNVRVLFGNKSMFGIEAAYVGSAQGIDAPGMPTNAVLVGSGVQGALRFAPAPELVIAPFLYAGAGWRHYSLTNASPNLSAISSSDNVAEFPFGLGLQYIYGGLLVDARLDYRITQDGNMMPAASNADMNRWGVQGNIGYQF